MSVVHSLSRPTVCREKDAGASQGVKREPGEDVASARALRRAEELQIGDDLGLKLWDDIRHDGALARLRDRLQAEHARLGTQEADRVVFLQVVIAGWLGEGLSERETAERVGVSLRTVQAAKGLIARLYHVAASKAGRKRAPLAQRRAA